jgi:hypothetical protein
MSRVPDTPDARHFVKCRASDESHESDETRRNFLPVSGPKKKVHFLPTWTDQSARNVACKPGFWAETEFGKII